jgi:hypothetical protein
MWIQQTQRIPYSIGRHDAAGLGTLQKAVEGIVAGNHVCHWAVQETGANEDMSRLAEYRETVKARRTDRLPAGPAPIVKPPLANKMGWPTGCGDGSVTSPSPHSGRLHASQARLLLGGTFPLWHHLRRRVCHPPPTR